MYLYATFAVYDDIMISVCDPHLDRQHNYESNLVQQYKEQLKDCQMELSEKSEQLESLILEKRDAIAEKGKDIDRLLENIARIRQEHIEETKELEKKWKAIVQQRIDNLQVKHEEELNELTKEWQNERKVKSSSNRIRIILFGLVLHIFTYTRARARAHTHTHTQRESSLTPQSTIRRYIFDI